MAGKNKPASSVSVDAKEKNNTIIERISGIVICISNVLATVAFFMGIIRFGGKSISLFSAISMILSVMDLSSSLNPYGELTKIIIGVLYCIFLAKAITSLPKVLKNLIAMLNPKIKRSEFKYKLSEIMKSFYSNITNQFVIILIGSALGSMELSINEIAYFSISLFIFVLGYAIRLRFFTDSAKMYFAELAKVLVYIFALASVLYYVCAPTVQACVQNVTAFEEICADLTFKEFCSTAYTYFIENIIFLLIMFIVLHSYKNMFSYTTGEDLYFFESKGAAKKIVTLSSFMIICRSIISIYLQSSSSVSTSETISIIRHIFTSNRFDLIPLLIIGIGMMIMTSYTEKSKSAK